MKFAELDLHPDLLSGIRDIGFTECTEVQGKTLPSSLAGHDIIVQSQTGSGKTAAFLIAGIDRFLKKSDEHVRMMVICPTRELAVQIEKEANALAKHTELKIGSIYGGVGYKQQEAFLAQDPDIIIGTPGRLLDFSKNKKINFSEINLLVIDEADRLFDMGFYPDLKTMLRQMPPYEKRQTQLLSATISERVHRLSWEFMAEPVEVEIQPEVITVESVTQRLYHVGRREKMSALLGILKRENPKNALIFTNTKNACMEIALRLKHNGYAATYMNGDIPQNKRLKVIESVKKGTTPILVATDVAARGIHIDDLVLVVNYDLPDEAENYVHRIGRTARVGKSGLAVSLACERFVYNLAAIEKYTRQEIEAFPVDDDLLVKDRSHTREIRREMEDEERVGRYGDKRVERGRGGEGVKSRRPRGEKPSSQREKQTTKSEEKPERPIRKKAARSSTQKTDNAKKRRERPERKSRKKTADRQPPVNPSTADGIEKRMEYYRRKYGENFTISHQEITDQPPRSSTAKGKKRSGFFRRLLSGITGPGKGTRNKK